MMIRTLSALRPSTVAVALVLAASASHAETIKITVDGMVCTFCAGSIEKKMKANKETADVFVSLENKLVAVAQKPGMKLDDARISAQIADAGYEVKKIERVSTPLADIRTSVRKK